uniref:Uncharacterized protein n=1 Tax=Arundo donax TaxID=35708 RepID=A0A0A9EMU4_ARUDO
MNINKISDQR